jgi:membrane fusion protein, multidrug efflux system
MRHTFLVGVGALVFMMAATVTTHGQEQPSVLVRITRVRHGSLPRLVTAYGTAEANSSGRIAVISPLPAMIDQVYVHDGEQVAKNGRLIRLSPSPKITAAFTQARTALAVARLSVERTRRLVHQHLATEQQLAAANRAELDARATLAALRAEGADAPTILRAPTRALITTVSTSTGALVGEGTVLLRLARPDSLVLRVGVMPTIVTTIKVGDKVEITPIGADDIITGKVQSVGSVVTAGTGLVPVQIAPSTHGLLAGEMAKAIITTGLFVGYVVPHEAILVDDRGQSFIVQAINGIAHRIPVKVSATIGDQNVVEGKLVSSAPLVLTGNYQLENGMKVRFADPASKAAP